MNAKGKILEYLQLLQDSLVFTFDQNTTSLYI